jgi:hypothetical protein
MGRRGFAAVAETVKRYDEERGRMFTRNFRLQPGETRTVRFPGPHDEPYIEDEHSIKTGPNDSDFMSLICAAGVGKPCVACHCNTAGDRRVGRPNPRATFNVADGTWVHKRKNEEKSAEAGKDRHDFIPCPDDESCKLCFKRSKVNPNKRVKTKAYETRERTGGVTWTCSMAVSNMALALNRQLQEVCLSCGFTSGKRAGKIRHVAWKCANKECNAPIRHELAEPGEEQSYPRCKKCGLKHTEKKPPREVVKCDKCSKGKRGSLFDVDVTVTRQGSKKNTVYTLTPASTFEPAEPWVNEIELVDLERAKAPMSSDAMAQKLGVQNPFKSKVGARRDAVSYDDEDDEFADDEEEETPKSKRGPPTKTPPKKAPPKAKKVKLASPKKQKRGWDEEE